MDDVIPASDELLLLPLGGAGEIGMNLTLYGHAGSWLAVDFGITFGGDDFPEHPVMMADPAFLEQRRERLLAIVLTHGHEDHIGALPYVWQRLRCPIYATPFTAALVRGKMARAGNDEAPVHEVVLGSRLHLGPFTVEFIGMTHSIPEPNALLIQTEAGAVLHTGDWKLDDRPVIGSSYDHRRLRSLRREPLLAMVCDSTNAVVAGHTPSEQELFQSILAVCEGARGRIVVTAFASNIARMVTLARVAHALGRRFGVVGQAMERLLAVARTTGYWPADLAEVLAARHLGHLPSCEVFAVCTGSQGEPKAAMARLARDMHPDLLLDPGDLVVFSSRLIPGNERSLERIQGQLRNRQVRLVTDRDAFVHVSGHPAEEDLRRLFQWVQPPLVIPVHGTPRHLAANAAIAAGCHVPEVRVIQNGDLCRLDSRGLRSAGSLPVGRLTVLPDGRLARVEEEQLRAMRETVH